MIFLELKCLQRKDPNQSSAYQCILYWMKSKKNVNTIMFTSTEIILRSFGVAQLYNKTLQVFKF